MGEAAPGSDSPHVAARMHLQRDSASAMLIKRLRQLFSQKNNEPVPGNGPVTVADILDRGWLELFYQPKIELRSKRLVGAEGLVRARHPVRGVISPGEFLPSASEADILALTERVIITALMDWSAWAELGMPLKLSVNVPVSALIKLPIPAILRERRPRASNWPGLIMEVTEDEILHDLKIANDVAESLREFKCTLALDDFGAGYSSLARLRQLPFSELKIDRSYVTNCDTDRQCGPLRNDCRARPALRPDHCCRGDRNSSREP
jgi:EAL domain-containing protein (putative c-di-GMP-specific phosphodiesterase class I)